MVTTRSFAPLMTWSFPIINTSTLPLFKEFLFTLSSFNKTMFPTCRFTAALHLPFLWYSLISVTYYLRHLFQKCNLSLVKYLNFLKYSISPSSSLHTSSGKPPSLLPYTKCDGVKISALTSSVHTSGVWDYGCLQLSAE